MKLFHPLILPILIALLMLSCFLEGTKVKHKFWLMLAFSPAFGLGICSLIFFWSYIFNFGQHRNTVLISSWVLFTALLIRQIPFFQRQLKKFNDWNVPVSEYFNFRLSDPESLLNLLDKLLTVLSFFLFCYSLFFFLKFFAADQN